jgi:hypothetical protein
VKLIELGGVQTDFGGRSMDFAMPDGLPDYAPIGKKFMDSLARSDRIPSQPEEIAEGIYEEATDDKS